jgi:hypothetical protein
MSEGKLEWFGGNQDGLNIFRLLIDLAHIWDDLVDKDKVVSEDDINYAFSIALVHLPANPLYKHIQSQLTPLWITTINGYQTANAFEKAKDSHGLEIAHTLRYAAGNIIAYLVHLCVGPEQAKKHLPDVWKAIVVERFDAYRKEHLYADPK